MKTHAPQSWTWHWIAVAVAAALSAAVAWTVPDAMLSPLLILTVSEWHNPAATEMVAAAHGLILVCLIPNVRLLGLWLAVGFPLVIVVGLALNTFAAVLLYGFSGEADRRAALGYLFLMLVQFAMSFIALRGVRRAPGRDRPSHALAIAAGLIWLWLGVYWWLWNRRDPMDGWWKAYAAIPVIWGAFWGGWRWLQPRRGRGLELDAR